MTKTTVWSKAKDEIPSVEVITEEQAELLKSFLRRGVEHYQFRDASLK